MPPPLPPGYPQVVRKHHARTVGYLLAMGPACVRIRDEEVRNVRRNLKPVTMDKLPQLRPVGSWLLAVLVGPNENVAAVMEWSGRLRAADSERVIVYYLPGADPVALLGSWIKASLPSPPGFEVSDFVSFHKLFGKHLNDRIWLDHR